ncbi:MAG: DUF4124 domain-containing protein [Zoogloeaceae bacterium]|nr:DUF4124 domain-containing protein [Zoogloeaceae bacterium]
MKKFLFPLVLLLSLPAFVAQAQVYKCTVNGKSAYSSTPCEGQAETRAINTSQDRVTEAQRQQAASVRAQEAREVGAEADKKNRAAARRDELATRQQREAAASAARAPSEAELADQCVDLYRPHMAYPHPRILGQKITGGSTFPEIVVNVRSITNPKTPIERDPITINENFTCRLTPDRTRINTADSQGYVKDYKGGVRR